MAEKPVGKRKCLNIEQKVAVLREVESKTKKKHEIAHAFGIPISTLSTILKNKDAILQAYNDGKLPTNRKRLRLAQHVDVEEALFTWFKDCRAKNIPVSGQTLQEKAKIFALSLGHENFNASGGWLGKFKERHSIMYRKKNCGHVVKVDDQSVLDKKFVDKMPQILQYSPQDVFNLVETGLFFRALPEETLTLKDEKCLDGKKGKDRVTVATCCNMDGSEKLKLLVIGKPEKPRCFTGIEHLPVDYTHNQKAWMTGKIFQEWLLCLDNKMNNDNRKILLLLDNVPSHVSSVKLTAVTLMFFPESTITPKMQTVIKCLKLNYRRRLIKQIFVDVEFNRETKIDLYAAVNMLNIAWQEISTDVIKNSFRKIITMYSQNTPAIGEENVELCLRNEPGDDDKMWNGLKLAPDFQFDSYVDIDSNLIANLEVNEDESDESENERFKPDPEVKSATALDCLQMVRRYFHQREEKCTQQHHYINQLENAVLENMFVSKPKIQ